MGSEDCLLREGETLDTLRGGELKIIQHRHGYRFSIDPLLLCGFVTVRSGAALLDLGCGSAIIAMLLARRSTAGRIVGVEIHPRQVERARRNVALNGLSERVEICQADIRSLDCATLGRFDCIVSNPPFRPLASGRCSQGDERAQARHELSGGLHDFLSCASALLNHGGTLTLIHLAERLVDVLSGMRAVGIEPKRTRLVHSRINDEARLVLVEGRKGGHPGLEVAAPLYVYHGENYSAEVQAMYGVAGGAVSL